VSLATWTAVAILGGGGAVLRFLVDGRVTAVTGRTFPFGTLAVNLSGALLLGVLVGATVDGDAYVLAGTATLGSYTTFSTWMYETQRLVEEGRGRSGALNLAVSLLLGLGAAAVGRLVGGRL
jgi:fluoride exporter